MKVSELIRQLEGFLETYGDEDVKMYADHGQCHMSVSQVTLSYTEDKSEWMSEPVHPDDVEGEEDKVCELG